MNILLVIVILILFFFALRGYQKGFVRKLASMLSLVISIVLVSAALPYITTYIKVNTPIYTFLVLQCQKVIQTEVSSQLEGGSEFNKTQSAEGSLDRDLIRSTLEEYGLDGSMIDGLSDEDMISLGKEYLGEDAVNNYIESGDISALDPYDTLGLGDGAESGENLGSGISGAIQELSQVQQTEIIKQLKLPKFIQDLLISNNNKTGYAKLSANSFQQYIVHYLATILLNVLAFVVALIVVQLILSIIFMLLNLLVKLPILRFINKVLGLGIGGLQGLLAIWLLFAVISFFSMTEIGSQAVAMIGESAFLTWLYESNLFLKIIMQITAAIL